LWAIAEDKISFEAIRVCRSYKKSKAGWQNKKLQVQGARTLCDEAYTGVRRNHNEMKRNAEIGLFAKPSGFVFV